MYTSLSDEFLVTLTIYHICRPNANKLSEDDNHGTDSSLGSY